MSPQRFAGGPHQEQRRRQWRLSQWRPDRRNQAALWIVTSTARITPSSPASPRAWIEQPVGAATIFAAGGLAAAQIEHSVTDIDFGLNMPPRMDPDDSFHDRSTAIGWVVGLGVESPLAEAWTVRLEGSYLDFGQSTHDVNRSGDGRCGPGMPRRPCPYTIEHQHWHRAHGDHSPVRPIADAVKK